jgi:hypothetical protein
MFTRKLAGLFIMVLTLITACAPAAAPAPTQAPAMAVTAAPAAEGPAADQSASGSNVSIKNVANASPYQANRLIIKNGEMTLLVEDTDRAIDQATGIAVDAGGYIVSSKTWIQGDDKYASLTMGVPSDQFEVVQRRLRGLALQVLNDVASGQDVSDEYVDLQSRLTNLQATEARIRGFLDKATKAEEALQVNTQLTQVQGEIEQVKGRMQYLKDRAAYSTIALEIHPRIPTPTPEPVTWLPGKTFNRAADALGSVLRGLGDLAIWLGVVAVPLAVPVVAVVFVGQRVRKKK